MPTLSPFLWFDDQAEEAAKFYTAIFAGSKIKEIQRYPEGAPVPAGTAMTVTFNILGHDIIAMNGGPHFKFTPAISLFVTVKTQKEVDDLWKKLSKGGQIQQCGWLTDKFGLSWQIIPEALGRLMGGKDRDKAGRVMQAMLLMTKIDIAALEKAAGAKAPASGKKATKKAPVKKKAKSTKKKTKARA